MEELGVIGQAPVDIPISKEKNEPALT